MTLQQLQYLVALAESNSINQAAQNLFVSQSGISKAIKQLEKALNTKLFLRTQKGVRLTTEGKLLYPYVERGMENLMDGEEMLKRLVDMDMGEVRIGASDMTLQFYLLPYLEKFHEQYPGIKVIVTNAPTPETLNYLREGHIDFGIVSTPFPERPDIQMIPVREIEDVFVAGRRFFSYKNRTLDFQKLESLPLIFLEKNTSSRSYMDEFLAGNGVYVQPEFELATSDMIVQFVRRNLGVGCVMRDFARDYVESGLLFELRFNKINTEASILCREEHEDAYGSGCGETVGDHGAGQTGRSEDIKVTAKRGYTGGNGTALTSKRIGEKSYDTQYNF